jgi:hypothetical protein
MFADNTACVAIDISLDGLVTFVIMDQGCQGGAVP